MVYLIILCCTTSVVNFKFSTIFCRLGIALLLIVQVQFPLDRKLENRGEFEVNNARPGLQNDDNTNEYNVANFHCNLCIIN